MDESETTLITLTAIVMTHPSLEQKYKDALLMDIKVLRSKIIDIGVMLKRAQKREDGEINDESTSS